MKPPVLLFSSLCSKVALYQSVLEQALKFNPKSKVIGVDSDKTCPGAHAIENFAYMPKLAELDQNMLLEYCKKKSISHIIPTRDGELSYWAEHQQKLEKNGIHTMNSSIEAIDFCSDKLRFYKDWTFSTMINSIPTELECSSDWQNGIVVKERIDSGSRSVGLNLSRNEAIEHSKNLTQPIFQPMIKGRELSAETWIDQNGKSHGVLLRWRMEVVNGESHHTSTFHDARLSGELIKIFEQIPGLRGHCLAQLMIQSEDSPWIIEINPRLGGASPIAPHAGMESILWFLLEGCGRNSEIPLDPDLRAGITLTKKGLEVCIS